MSYTCLSERAHCAQKQHRCIWCGEPILKGQMYTEVRSVYYGEFQHNRWHQECLDAAREEVRDGGDYEFMPYSNERP
jgi:hypothetical protein